MTAEWLVEGTLHAPDAWSVPAQPREMEHPLNRRARSAVIDSERFREQARRYRGNIYFRL